MMNCVVEIVDIKVRPGCCAEGLEQPVAKDSVVLKFKDDFVIMGLCTAIELRDRMALLIEGLLAVDAAATETEAILRKFTEREKRAEEVAAENVERRSTSGCACSRQNN